MRVINRFGTEIDRGGEDRRATRPSGFYRRRAIPSVAGALTTQVTFAAPNLPPKAAL
jgi:hypothetical protein